MTEELSAEYLLHWQTYQKQIEEYNQQKAQADAAAIGQPASPFAATTPVQDVKRNEPTRSHHKASFVVAEERYVEEDGEDEPDVDGPLIIHPRLQQESILGDSPEEIARWIAERRSNFPTRARAEQRIQKLEQQSSSPSFPSQHTDNKSKVSQKRARSSEEPRSRQGPKTFSHSALLEAILAPVMEQESLAVVLCLRLLFPTPSTASPKQQQPIDCHFQESSQSESPS